MILISSSKLSTWRLHLLLLALFLFVSARGTNGREHTRVQNTLKCYQCAIEGSDERICDDDLLQCPNNQAYDRCMVNTKRNATTGQITIIKGCALAPCEFEREVESIIFSGKCNLDRPGADCVRCCVGDGCNKRSRAEATRPWRLILIPTLILKLIYN